MNACTNLRARIAAVIEADGQQDWADGLMVAVLEALERQDDEIAKIRAERDSGQKALASYRDLLAPMLAPEPVKCDGSCNGTEFGDCSDPGHGSSI